MPEMWFTVRWPGGDEQRYYSPSLVVHDHLVSGTDYTVEEFVSRTDTAMAEASERVRQKFGFACTSAAETSNRIHNDAATRAAGGSSIRVLSLEPPLPH